MSSKTKPTKLALVASIIAVILIGFYTFVTQDAGPSQATSKQQPEQVQLGGKDPFKEFLDKQQQSGGSTQMVSPSPSLQSLPMQSGGGIPVTNTTTGTDPFKAFLEAQPKAKPEEAANSPFAGAK